MRIDINQTADILKSKNNILIVAHESPDGDAAGSAYGLCRGLASMGKNVRVALDSLPKKMSFMAEGLTDDGFYPDFTVAVDTADNKILGVENAEITKNDRINLCIDHHYSNVFFADDTCLDDSAAAASEIVFDILRLLGAEITKTVAECLYVGIATDTGCFRFNNTTAKTLRTAAELIDLGADSAELNRLHFETKSKSYASLEQMAISSMKSYFDGKCAMLTITNDMFVRSGAEDGETSPLASLPREIEGVLVGITMKEKQRGTFRISVRTNPPADASEIASVLGGGGHKMAAGCTLEGNVNTVTKTMLKCVQDYLADEGLL